MVQNTCLFAPAPCELPC